MVREEDVTIESLKKGAAPAKARGRWQSPRPPLDAARLSVRVIRSLTPDSDVDVDVDGAAGSLGGSWHPNGPDGPAVSGLMATVVAG